MTDLVENKMWMHIKHDKGDTCSTLAKGAFNMPYRNYDLAFQFAFSHLGKKPTNGIYIYCSKFVTNLTCLMQILKKKKLHCAISIIWTFTYNSEQFYCKIWEQISKVKIRDASPKSELFTFLLIYAAVLHSSDTFSMHLHHDCLIEQVWYFSR